MLKDLLRAIDSGHVSRKEDIAAGMGTEVSAVEGMIDFLVKKEYLKVTESGPATEKCNCGHCGIKGYCAGPGRTYVVTEKGKKLADSRMPGK
jgi:hypothetical protein